MNLDETLYFGNIRWQPGFGPIKFWKSVQDSSGEGGKFFMDLGKKFSPSRFVARDGEWSLPWKQKLIPGFEMPIYNPAFNKSFEEVTDNRANYVRGLIQQGKKVAVMYSGGIDSTLIIISLIKNLSSEEIKSVVISTSVHAIIENPYIWETYIQGKFTIIESLYNWYDDIINAGYMPITADEGDCIMGTSIGLQLYHNYDVYLNRVSPETKENLKPLKYKISDGSVHYSRYKDIIIMHLAYDTTLEGLNFGQLLYEKYVHNINTSSVPIHSLHDFFWWLIFNVKYLNCSVRSAIFFNDSLGIKECSEQTINWFNGTEYQLWSMVNNNNGQKIQNTLATYKYAARTYIYNFDNNDWYFHFKTKLESLSNLRITGKVNNMRFDNRHILGVNDRYEWLCLDEPGVGDFFKNNINNYQIDWLTL